MLDIVRANTKSIFTWIIVLGIAFIFAVNFGPGSLSKGQSSGCGAPKTWAATVNGETIPVSEWERTVRLYEQQLGGGVSREMLAQLGIGQQALSMLVDQELAIQEAKRRGIVVTDDEISRAVHRNPEFQENGRFDFEKYKDLTRQAYGGPEAYENVLRRVLLSQKVSAVLAQTVKVPDADVRDAWQQQADRANLSFVLFPVNAAREEVRDVSDADVKAFVAKEGARLEKFYADNQARYDQKQKVHVRHLLAATGPGKDEAAAQKKAEDAVARLKKGEPFAKVAAELSDDPNAKTSGGDLGFISEGLVAPEIYKAASGLEKGKFSDPVKTPRGFEVLYAEEIIPARKIALDAVRADIAKELLQKDRAEKLVADKAQALFDAVKKGKSLYDLYPSAEAVRADPKKKAVKIGSATVATDETGPFAVRAAYLPKLGNARDIGDAAGKARSGDLLPRVFDTPAGKVVAVVKLRETPVEADFQAQKLALVTRLEAQRGEEARRAWLAGLREQAKVVENTALVSAPLTRAVEE